jgi:hypothetical protein
MSLAIFSDGTNAPLRHGLRLKRNGDKLHQCKKSAKIPESWKSKVLVAAGAKKPKALEDPIPSFDLWRKVRRKNKTKMTGIRPAADTKAMPRVGIKEMLTKSEGMTPALPGGMTPMDFGAETPRLPPGETPHLPGVETPGHGAETPFPMGEETPRVPHTLPEGEIGSKGEATPMGMGDTTPHQVPRTPLGADLRRHKVKMEATTPRPGAETPFPGEETPRVPHTVPSIEAPSREIGETPLPALPGEETPRVRAETPTPLMLPPGMDTPQLPMASGMETPGLPPSLPVADPATPRRPGTAAATTDLTPGWEPQRKSGEVAEL